MTCFDAALISAFNLCAEKGKRTTGLIEHPGEVKRRLFKDNVVMRNMLDTA
jgi:hypothetical protein